jgi:hypothetical protein
VASSLNNKRKEEVSKWMGLQWLDIVTYFVCVTADGVWIGEWIYWSLMHTPIGTSSNHGIMANHRTL